MTAPFESVRGRYFLRVVERDVEVFPVLLDVDLLVEAFEVEAFAVEAFAVDDLAVEALLVDDLLAGDFAVEALLVDDLLAGDFAVEALLVLVGADLLDVERLVEVFDVELLADVPREEVVLAVARGDVVVAAERLVDREVDFGADLLDEVRVEVPRVDVRLAVPVRAAVVEAALPVLFADVLVVDLLEDGLLDAVRAAEAFAVLCFGSFFEPLTTSLK